ncbi:hypothetical protein ASG65_27145 [Bacillus sp. Leaf13]|nr:hypothetical protein ASG65_27145 [Bacillus sp. Leaf13]KRF54258.1 hypothetical protein ASG99_27590 [Bacillus sp. Soil768D1]
MGWLFIKGRFRPSFFKCVQVIPLFYSYDHFPFTYKPQSEYKDSTVQAGDIMMELYRKNYKTEDGNTLTIGDFEIPLK